ncbi:5'-nucleotidase C-terminal domain-containing protein [Variovorax sp. LjRoot130]|uniref:5'-nucleotidase C-terminal domain-containing protein n=1 Tax=Variovorax sp. LjRoot130 TaxID=3342261 RepID=UPI003F50F304
MQPFGNSLVVKTMTGAQIKAMLEQQFNSGTNTVAASRVLLPSRLRHCRATQRQADQGSRLPERSEFERDPA